MPSLSIGTPDAPCKADFDADNTHMIITSMNVAELAHQAQEELTRISEYMRFNKLSTILKNRVYDNWTPSWTGFPKTSMQIWSTLATRI